jgi:hypothetical protein
MCEQTLRVHNLQRTAALRVASAIVSVHPALASAIVSVHPALASAIVSVHPALASAIVSVHPALAEAQRVRCCERTYIHTHIYRSNITYLDTNTCIHAHTHKFKCVARIHKYTILSHVPRQCTHCLRSIHVALLDNMLGIRIHTTYFDYKKKSSTVCKAMYPPSVDKHTCTCMRAARGTSRSLLITTSFIKE